MPEIQLGAHTIRTHGATVAGAHMHDWFVFIFLVIMEIILNVIEPFHRFVGAEMMEDLRGRKLTEQKLSKREEEEAIRRANALEDDDIGALRKVSRQEYLKKGNKRNWRKSEMI